MFISVRYYFFLARRNETLQLVITTNYNAIKKDVYFSTRKNHAGQAHKHFEKGNKTFASELSAGTGLTHEFFERTIGNAKAKS